MKTVKKADRFAYISLTGENCHITNVEVKKEETSVEKNYIKRIAEEISYIEGCPQGDIPNLQVSKKENFKGWEAWKEANKSGLDCVARFKRDGNTVVVKTENCGIEITAVTEIKVSVPEIYVSLTGDQCALTDIRVKRPQ